MQVRKVIPQSAPVPLLPSPQSNRIDAVAVDFFSDPLPPAGVITIGMILHHWNLQRKKLLVTHACEALPTGGAFVAIDALIDDAWRANTFQF